MKQFFFLKFFWVFCFYLTAWIDCHAQVPATTQTSRFSLSPNSEQSPLSKAQFSVSYLTSKTQKTDYRTFKTMSSGDSSGMSDGATLPNLNYVAGHLLLPISERHSLSAMGLQSLDNDKQRTVETPFAVDLKLPASVLALGYKYKFNSAISLDAKFVSIESLGPRDPSLGFSYMHAAPERTQLYSVTSSVPSTESSLRDQLITRSVFKALTTWPVQSWTFSAAAIHVRSFYSQGLPATPAKQRSSNKPTTPIYPSQVDLILIEKEWHRTRVSFGTSYSLSDKLKINFLSNMSQVVTEKNNTLWITSITPLGLSLNWNRTTISSDLSLHSDIEKYNYPRLPTLLSLSLRAGYSFGANPPSATSLPR